MSVGNVWLLDTFSRAKAGRSAQSQLRDDRAMTERGYACAREIAGEVATLEMGLEGHSLDTLWV